MRSKMMPARRRTRGLLNLFPVLIVLLVVATLFGGSSRADVWQVVLLRPAGVIVLAIALFNLDRETRTDYRAVLILLASTFAVFVAQLVPLPPALVYAMPGHGVVAEIDEAAGLSGMWRSWSLDPEMTRDALWSLALPAAAMLLAMRLDRGKIRMLILAVLAIGAASALLGVLQYSGGASSPFYFYRVTNNGFSVGFFANRNHQGAFLAALLPIAAAYAALHFDRPVRRTARTENTVNWAAPFALAFSAVITPTILATGSRAGLIVAALGILGGIAVALPAYLSALDKRSHKAAAKRPRPKRMRLAWIAAGSGLVAFLALIGVGVGMRQSGSLARLAGGGETQDLRLPLWERTAQIGWEFFPFGSGFGSFRRVFEMREPDDMLWTYYYNNAHNDYVQVFQEGGVFGLALVAVLLVLAIAYGARVWLSPATEEVLLARGAIVSLVLLAISSAVDYPIRSPLMAVFVGILIVVLRRGGLPQSAERARD